MSYFNKILKFFECTYPVNLVMDLIFFTTDFQSVKNNNNKDH